MSEWKPIETAPRGRDNEFIGWDGQYIDKTWEGWDEDGVPVYVHADYISWEPTHWMPLPAPPNGVKMNIKPGNVTNYKDANGWAGAVHSEDIKSQDRQKDIVERLRECSADYQVLDDAADEIERLRKLKGVK